MVITQLKKVHIKFYVKISCDFQWTFETVHKEFYVETFENMYPSELLFLDPKANY